MTYITPLLAALLTHLVALCAPIVVPIAVLFARWDLVTSKQDGLLSTYGDLPEWASWFTTPDARLPGGLYEPTVAKMLGKYGCYLTSVYWLGLRNRAHGFAALFAKPASQAQFHQPQAVGFTQLGDGIWLYKKPLGALVFMCGYRVYDLRNGDYIASPCLTIKKA